MKNTTRNAIIVLFILFFIAIVIGGQTLSTISNNNNIGNEISCSVVQDCIDTFNEDNIPIDVLNSVNVYCNSGICEVEPK